MTLGPITLYSHTSGPNAWKVAIILSELEIPYKTIFMEMDEMHKPEFLLINPNGKVPVIQDPNTNLTLCESAAIIEYLMEQYDTENRLSFASFPEKHLIRQYLYMQMSGQGPYFGQAIWFQHYHPETVLSAQERYNNEVRRFTGVLDSILKEKKYLVGEKCTHADLIFVTWGIRVGYILKLSPEEVEKAFPYYTAWLNRLKARPAVKKVLEEKFQVSDH